MLEKAGGICLMLENESSGKAIYDTAMEILGDSTKREGMHKAMLSLSVADAARTHLSYGNGAGAEGGKNGNLKRKAPPLHTMR